MTEHIVTAFWIAGLVLVVGVALAGLAAEQIRIWRINARVRRLRRGRWI